MRLDIASRRSVPSTADVSVVIPSFNAGLLLYRAIKSVLDQTVSVTEILVVDDASTDGSVARAQAYFPQIRVISFTHNAGVSAARNCGAENARGRWIAFLDADDRWLPEKIALQTAGLEQSGADVSLGGFLDIRASNTRRWGRAVVPGPLHEMLAYPIPLNTSTLVLRRSLFLATGGYRNELTRGEDIEFYYRLALKKPLCIFIQNSVSEYHHDNPESLTAEASALVAYSMLKTLLLRDDVTAEFNLRRAVLTSATRHMRTRAYSLLGQDVAVKSFVDDLCANGEKAELKVLRLVVRLPRPFRAIGARVALLPTRLRQGRLPACGRC